MTLSCEILQTDLSSRGLSLLIPRVPLPWHLQVNKGVGGITFSVLSSTGDN